MSGPARHNEEHFLVMLDTDMRRKQKGSYKHTLESSVTRLLLEFNARSEIWPPTVEKSCIDRCWDSWGGGSVICRRLFTRDKTNKTLTKIRVSNWILNSWPQCLGRVRSYTFSPHGYMSRDSSVVIALGYGLDDRGSGVRFPAGVGNFSLHHWVQNGSGPHPASYPVGTRGSFPGGKAAGAWS
jgi:hypothetical protein